MKKAACLGGCNENGTGNRAVFIEIFCSVVTVKAEGGWTDMGQ